MSAMNIWRSPSLKLVRLDILSTHCVGILKEYLLVVDIIFTIIVIIIIIIIITIIIIIIIMNASVFY
jgi:hypothetical protein